MLSTFSQIKFYMTPCTSKESMIGKLSNSFTYILIPESISEKHSRSSRSLKRKIIKCDFIVLVFALIAASLVCTFTSISYFKSTYNI